MHSCSCSCVGWFIVTGKVRPSLHIFVKYCMYLIKNAKHAKICCLWQVTKQHQSLICQTILVFLLLWVSWFGVTHRFSVYNDSWFGAFTTRGGKTMTPLLFIQMIIMPLYVDRCLNASEMSLLFCTLFCVFPAVASQSVYCESSQLLCSNGDKDMF